MSLWNRIIDYAISVGLVLFVMVIIGLIGWYVYYIWSDCLGENGILTCMRMLR